MAGVILYSSDRSLLKPFAWLFELSGNIYFIDYNLRYREVT
jgi:hypothetical protein